MDLKLLKQVIDQLVLKHNGDNVALHMIDSVLRDGLAKIYSFEYTNKQKAWKDKNSVVKQ